MSGAKHRRAGGRPPGAITLALRDMQEGDYILLANVNVASLSVMMTREGHAMGARFSRRKTDDGVVVRRLS